MNDQQGRNKISFIMYMGIGCFIIPVITNIFHWKLPGWFFTIGILLIFIGAGHTIYLNVAG